MQPTRTGMTHNDKAQANIGRARSSKLAFVNWKRFLSYESQSKAGSGEDYHSSGRRCLNQADTTWIFMRSQARFNRSFILHGDFLCNERKLIRHLRNHQEALFLKTLKIIIAEQIFSIQSNPTRVSSIG